MSCRKVVIGVKVMPRHVSEARDPRVLLATLLILAFAVTGFAQNLDAAGLDAFLDRLAEKRKAMGSLVIARDGQIIYSRAIGYGQIDSTLQKPLTADSRFGLASITKTYTAVMILQLVEEGKLELTGTLDRFYPQVPNAAKITIAQLLAHRSGIPGLGPLEAGGAPMSSDEMLARIARGTPEFEPDAAQSYSNSGYFVLARVVETVTGRPYGEALQERIASKVGLSETYAGSARIDVNRNESLTYWNMGSEWKPGRVTRPSVFEIVSTPADMAKFIEALFDLKLISRQSLDLMTTIRDGEGLGLVTFAFAGRTFYGNTGGGDNYGAWLAYEPEEQLAIAYATNAKVYPVASIVSGVVDLCYHRPFQIPALESLELDPALLDRYVGVYSCPDAPAKATVTREGSVLFFQPPGAGPSSALALEATAEDTFQIEGLAVFTFDSSNARMTVKRRDGIRVFTKDP